MSGVFPCNSRFDENLDLEIGHTAQRICLITPNLVININANALKIVKNFVSSVPNE